MHFINCVYTDGIDVQFPGDINNAVKTLKKEDDDTVIINRLFKFFEDDYDPDFTDTDEIEVIYKKMYPNRKQDKKLIKNVLNLLSEK